MKDQKHEAKKEIAKAVRRGFDSLDALGRFIEDAFGYPIREAGEFLGDWIKFKRDNWLKTCQEVKSELDFRGVEVIVPIPAKYGIAIIEKASLEDDELLQKMWAGLIANSLDPSSNISPRKILLSLLAELEPLDARLILEVGKLEKVDFRLAEIIPKLGVPLENLLLPIDNLCRLELLRSNAAFGFGGANGMSETSPFSLTRLGDSLLKSVETSKRTE